MRREPIWKCCGDGTFSSSSKSIETGDRRQIDERRGELIGKTPKRGSRVEFERLKLANYWTPGQTEIFERFEPIA